MTAALTKQGIGRLPIAELEQSIRPSSKSGPDKAQLSSDSTSCRSPLANQMRLILHTCAYWLLLDLRAAIPSWNPLRHTEFATIRLRLLKIASRIIEHASRIRIALASCCPEAETFTLVALKLQPSGP